MERTILFALLFTSLTCIARPEARLFVSFSMPDTLLSDYLHQSEKYHIPLVFRGLYHNSFRQMMGKMKTLSQLAPNADVLIDPREFKRFHITRVPTLVIGTPTHYDSLSGNLSINSALETIAEQGDNKQQAKQILEGGK